MLQSMGSQRVGHDLATEQQQQHTYVGGKCSKTERRSISLVLCGLDPEFRVAIPLMGLFEVEGKHPVYFLGQRSWMKGMEDIQKCLQSNRSYREHYSYRYQGLLLLEQSRCCDLIYKSPWLASELIEDVKRSKE